MMVIAPTRRSDFGMTCARCGEALIAPEWSKYVDERRVVNLWSCTECGCQFETAAYVPANTKFMNDNIAIKPFFPSLLVA
jgi:ribosomal protein L37AE/L43A